MALKYDFSGYVTKSNVVCSDKRIISPGAFTHQDNTFVPLVWGHYHDSPDRVIGKILLKAKNDGMYGYGQFNDTTNGINARKILKHGDVDSLSIFANHISQNGPTVCHGDIVEVSMVLVGANPGAKIDNVTIAHDDGENEVIDEAVMSFGEPIQMGDYDNDHNDQEDANEDGGTICHADGGDNKDDEGDDDETIGDIFNSMTDKQKDAVYFLIGSLAQNETVKQSDNNEGDEISMGHNVFEESATNAPDKVIFTAEDFNEIVHDAMETGSFKNSFIAHAQTYGIENIDILFPDAKTLQNDPEFIKREMDWVRGVLSGTRHAPFTRIKSVLADITMDEARARGYVKGNRKKEEVFKVMKRVTTPTTVYKKQKLDRDDIIDITDFDVVVWLKQEMRMMLDEEIARAILIGDGRDISSEDKISEDNIRPIWTDDEIYTEGVLLEASDTPKQVIERVIRARKNYRGSGNPVFYTTTDVLIDMLLIEDTTGRRIYNNESELASALRVSKIVEVPVMENVSRQVESVTHNLVGIIVNLKDYTIGTDRGGNISFFDDFDIDYNQYKYLYETRMSGCLTVPKSAIILERKGA